MLKSWKSECNRLKLSTVETIEITEGEMSYNPSKTLSNV